MEKTKLSKVVKDLRKEYGLTQEDLAMKKTSFFLSRINAGGKPLLVCPPASYWSIVFLTLTLPRPFCH